MNTIILPVLGGLLIFALLTYAPFVLLVILLVNFALVAAKGLLQLHFSLLKPSVLAYSYPEHEEPVSIHVAAYNEPPGILINTLKHLSRLTYGNYEVIVVDNNTRDEKIWMPVRDYCRRLGKKFRFYHVDNMKGFKAGALRFAKSKMNPAARFIAVIDADYEVNPDFMTEASRYFTNDRIAFVQFPQAYKNSGRSNIGLTLEYGHFFRTYMNMANYYNCVMATGTLSIFRVDVLKRIGYFSPNYITEDAELGLRLNRSGYRGLYVPKIVGRGLIPFDMDSYRKQKSRWALGNIQILKHSAATLLFDERLTLKQKIGFLAQLSAWTNFTILPIVTVFTAAILRLLPGSSLPWLREVVILSGSTIFIFLALKIASFYSLFHEHYPPLSVLKALLVHIGSGSIYSLTAVRLFLKTSFFFERTNKFLPPVQTFGTLRTVLIELFLGLSSFMLAAYHFMARHFWTSIALLMVSAIYLTVIAVLRELRPTRNLSVKLLK